MFKKFRKWVKKKVAQVKKAITKARGGNHNSGGHRITPKQGEPPKGKKSQDRDRDRDDNNDSPAPGAATPASGKIGSVNKTPHRPEAERRADEFDEQQPSLVYLGDGRPTYAEALPEFNQDRHQQRLWEVDMQAAGLGNPLIQTIAIAVRNTPRQFYTNMRNANSIEEGLHFLFADYGMDEEWDAEAVEMVGQLGGFTLTRDGTSYNLQVGERANIAFGVDFQSGIGGPLGVGVVGSPIAMLGFDVKLQVGDDPITDVAPLNSGYYFDNVTTDHANSIIRGSNPQIDYILDYVEENQDYYIEAAETIYPQVIDFALRQNGLDPQHATDAQVQAIIEEFGLPSSPEEFAARAATNAALLNMSEWAGPRSGNALQRTGNLFTKTSGLVEGLVLGVMNNDGGILGSGLVGRGGPRSLGPLELELRQFTGLMLGTSPTLESDTSLTDQSGYLAPLPLDRFFEEFTGGSSRGMSDEAMSRYLFSHYAMGSPELVAWLTIQREAGFTQLYIEEYTSGNLDPAQDGVNIDLRGDPYTFNLYSTIGGYSNEVPHRRREEEVSRIYNERALIYEFLLFQTRETFNSTEANTSPLIISSFSALDSDEGKED